MISLTLQFTKGYVLSIDFFEFVDEKSVIRLSQNTLCRVKPYLFFELHCSYCFDPNTYEFKEELINWDYEGFWLGFE